MPERVDQSPLRRGVRPDEAEGIRWLRNLADIQSRVDKQEEFDRIAMAVADGLAERDALLEALRDCAEANPWTHASDIAATHLARFDRAHLDGGMQRVTHGRHCTCSACAREDWTQPHLAPCGMHGSACPAVYAPIGAPGSTHLERTDR